MTPPRPFDDPLSVLVIYQLVAPVVALASIGLPALLGRPPGARGVEGRAYGKPITAESAAAAMKAHLDAAYRSTVAVLDGPGLG